MTEGSFFLSKINSEETGIPTYNIIGTGCQTNSKDGDGIVKAENAKLNYAKNYYIPGNCSGIELLHTSLIHPEKYPQAIEKLKEILKN